MLSPDAGERNAKGKAELVQIQLGARSGLLRHLAADIAQKETRIAEIMAEIQATLKAGR
jgi:hypothetical protein